MEEHDQDMRRRVIHSLLGPAARFAAHFGVPLREMKEWFGVAYLHELKRIGLTQQESAAHIDVSRRTVIALTKKLRDDFFDPEHRGELRRRALAMLWAEPMTLGRLKQALAEAAEPERVAAILDQMIEAGEVSCEGSEDAPTLSLTRNAYRAEAGAWFARVDALNHQLGHLADAVFSRFFAGDDRAWARTVSLSIAPEDRGELERFYREVVWPELARLDGRAEQSEEADRIELSLSWAPKGALDRARESSS